MPIPARKSRTSSCSRSERFSSGIRSTATAINSQVQSAQESSALCGTGANQHFHQEFQNFNMTLGFLQARTPSIKPMLLQKKTMNAGVRLKRFRNAVAQFDHVLRVLENRQPLAVFMRSNALQPLEHFVSFEC